MIQVKWFFVSLTLLSLLHQNLLSYLAPPQCSYLRRTPKLCEERGLIYRFDICAHI